MFVPMMDRLQETKHATVGIHRSLERCGDKSRLCSHVDVVPSALSDRARELRNPVDSTDLAVDIPVPWVPQDEPT